MRALSASLQTTTMILKQPMKKEIIVCLVSTGWYNTYNNLEMYKANDTKYPSFIALLHGFDCPLPCGAPY